MKTHDKKVTAEKPAVPKTKDPIFRKHGPPFLLDEAGKYTLNQRAIAYKCASTHTIIYYPTTKTFERYDKTLGLWLVEHRERVMQLLDNMLVELGEEYEAVNFVQQMGPSKLKSLHEMLQLFPVDVKAEKVEGLVHVTNGIVDLRGDKPKLIKHDPKYRFNFGSGVKFDAKAKCPRFLKQLLEPALPKDDIRLVQKYFGSMLLGPNKSQTILIIRGTAGGGKGTLVNVMEKVLGEHYVADLRAKHLNGRFETSAFLGKRLLIGKDVPGDTLQERGARYLKSLVGDDLMQAEIKYNPTKQPLRGDFHVVLVSNNHLRIALDGDEDAWARRLMVVDYEMAKTTKPIPGFANKLFSSEASGVLNWLLEGAMISKAEMDDPGKLVLTDEQVKRVEKLLHDSDSVKSFVVQRVAVAEGGDVSSEELLMNYFALCKEKKWTPVTSHEFQTRVPDILALEFKAARRNDIQREGSAVRGYKGIGLN